MSCGPTTPRKPKVDRSPGARREKKQKRRATVAAALNDNGDSGIAFHSAKEEIRQVKEEDPGIMHEDLRAKIKYDSDGDYVDDSDESSTGRVCRSFPNPNSMSQQHGADKS